MGLRPIRSLTWKIRDLMAEEMWTDRNRLESNRTPRFWAVEKGTRVTVEVMEREALSILESFLGKTNKWEFSFWRIEHEKICRHLWRDFSNYVSKKRNICMEFVRREIINETLSSSAYRWWWTEDLDMMVHRIVVYKINRTKNRTIQKLMKRRLRIHNLDMERPRRKVRFDSLFRAVPEMPNHDERRSKRIEWSIVSNAAVRS
jgi:hypothetical protein